jgi:hypothetical protein
VRDLKMTTGSVSLVLPFEPGQFRVVKRGIYTAILTSQGAPQGEAGDPALPWRKFLIFIPDGAKFLRARFEIRRTAQLVTHALIEPIQPNAPITTTEQVKSVGPNPQVYERSAIWPPGAGRLVVVRRLGGKQLVEIEVCALQYHPAARQVDLVQEVLVEVEFTEPPGVLRADKSPLPARFERRILERVKNYVLNADHVASRFDIDRFPLDLPTYPEVPYVIVTARALMGAFQRLADWRTTLGRNARVVAIEDIQGNTVAQTGGAQFWLSSGYADGGTRDLAEAIRNFIKWAQVHWQTEFVLLGGDTSVIPARSGWIPLNQMNYGDIGAPDVSKNLTTTASASSSALGSDPANALDTDASTFWSCASTDGSPWISAALTGPAPVNHVQLTWGATAATSYKIQISSDNVTWTDVYAMAQGVGGTEEISFGCKSARFLRLVVRSGTNFRLATMKVFGPAAYNTAYALSPTRTRIYLRSWIQPNPTNSPDGDQLVVVAGPRTGTVVPYNTASNDTVLGWHFVTDLTQVPGTVSSGYTSYLEICGPAEFHGSALCPKTSEDYIPADLYYADLDSPNAALHDWDADGNRVYGERYGGQIDGVNGMADVHVGRFPITTPGQVDLVVSKVIQYERYRDVSEFEPLLTPGFAIAALLAAQNWYDPGPGYLDGSASCNEDIRHLLIASGSGWTFTRLYEDKADVPAADTTSDLNLASKDAIKDAIALGNNVLSLVSHGNPSYLCYLIPSDVDDEASTPSIWYANACTTNKFDSTSISETAILNPRGSAVAYAGNSRYGWTGDGPMENAFWEEMLQSGLLGPMLERAHLTGGDWQKYSLNLLGDPAMRVWSAAPRHVTASYPSDVFTGIGLPLVVTVKCEGAPVASATVCITSGGAYHTSADTDATGVARLRTSFTVPGRAQIAVSGKNMVPYIGSILVKLGQPGIAVMPPNMNFGTVAVGAVSTRTLTVTSTGTSVATVSIPAPQQPSPFHWKAVNSTQLMPGATLMHEVSLAPTSAGSLHGSLSVVSDASGSPATIPLAGTAVVSPPACKEGVERYERCWVNGRAGYRRLTCVNGKWVAGACKPGEIP